MLLVTIICSDPDCIEEGEIAVKELDALDAHACDCGHGFVVVAVSELDEPARTGSVVPLPDRRTASNRRAA